MKKLSSSQARFGNWLRALDANLLTIVIGVLTVLSINTLTGFGYQWQSVVASVIFLGAIACIIAMLQIQRKVREDEAGFLEFLQYPDTTKDGGQEGDAFENLETMAFERAITTNPKRQRGYFAASGLTIFYFLGGMFILYLTSRQSQRSSQTSSDQLSNADSVINSQNVRIAKLEKVISKDDSLLVLLAKKQNPPQTAKPAAAASAQDKSQQH